MPPDTRSVWLGWLAHSRVLVLLGDGGARFLTRPNGFRVRFVRHESLGWLWLDDPAVVL